MMRAFTPMLQTLSLALVLPGLVACGADEDNPEAEVRAWVAAMQMAAEDKDRGDLMNGVSAAYADVRGNTREDINNRLRVYFLRQNSVKFLTSIDEINVIGDTAAEVALTVGMAGTNDGMLGISADAYRFELELENDGEDWLLISARWGELGDPLR